MSKNEVPEWAAAAITVPYGNNDQIRGEVEIVGWRKDHWFLDYRVNELEDGDIKGLWGLTHIPTGWFCCAIYYKLDQAKSVVEEIEAWGDWQSAVEPKEIREKFTPAAKETSLSHAGKVRFGTAPLWAQITHETPHAAKDARHD